MSLTRILRCLVAAALLILGGCVVPGEKTGPVPIERVHKTPAPTVNHPPHIRKLIHNLIAQLADDRFLVREDAFKRLAKMLDADVTVVPILNQARANIRDPEPRHQLGRLLRRAAMKLLTAATQKDWEQVSFLLELGVEPSSTDERGCTVLHLAIFSRHRDIVAAAIASGANMEAVVSKSEKNPMSAMRPAPPWGSPLDCSMRSVDPRIIKLLLDAGAKPNGTHLANTIHQIPTFRMLLDAGAQPTEGNELLHYAVSKRGHPNLVALLLETGAKVDERRSYLRQTPLHLARDAYVESLIRAGADVNAQDEAGLTPLHYAVRDGQMVKVRLLLAAGADSSISDTFDLTASDWVDIFGKRKAFPLLPNTGTEKRNPHWSFVVNLRSEIDLVIYDLRDLPCAKTRPTSEKDPAHDLSGFVALVRSQTGPEMWTKQKGTMLEARQGKLIVIHNTRVHERIEKLLKHLRSFSTFEYNEEEEDL